MTWVSKLKWLEGHQPEEKYSAGHSLMEKAHAGRKLLEIFLIKLYNYVSFIRPTSRVLKTTALWACEIDSLVLTITFSIQNID